MITCCHYCQDRTVGCHAHCDRYIKNKKEHDEARMKEFAERNAVNDAYAIRMYGKPYTNSV